MEEGREKRDEIDRRGEDEKKRQKKRLEEGRGMKREERKGE